MGAALPVKVADIAKACGVSPATVSLVLKGSPLVNAKTREKVEAEIKRSGYVYNRAAANLRKQVSTVVALIINDLANPFFAEFASGVDNYLAQRGFVTLLGHSGESVERQAQVLNSLVQHSPVGIILSPAEHTEAEDLTMLNRNLPVLVFNREVPGSWNFLGLDNQTGAEKACQHLLHLGHQQIVFVGGHADSPSCSQRRAGYARAMQLAGKKEYQRFFESAPTKRGGFECASQILEHLADQTPSGFVCYNDAVALGVCQALANKRIRVGWQASVVGFDDIQEAGDHFPPLTTMTTSPKALGERAAEMIFKIRPDTVLHEIVPVELMIRQSTGPK